jgi:hypothetical protein
LNIKKWFLPYIHLSNLLELELIQTQMAQKPMLRAEVGMRVRCANNESASVTIHPSSPTQHQLSVRVICHLCFVLRPSMQLRTNFGVKLDGFDDFEMAQMFAAADVKVHEEAIGNRRETVVTARSVLSGNEIDVACIKSKFRQRLEFNFEYKIFLV